MAGTSGNFDGYDAYRVGRANGHVYDAQEALKMAFGDLFVALGLDHPTIQKLKEAEEAMRALRYELADISSRVMSGGARDLR